MKRKRLALSEPLFISPIVKNVHSRYRVYQFFVTVKYHAHGKEYRKVFSSQHPASRQALYPVSLEEGQEIPVKYPERFPALAVLDPEGLKRVW